MKPVTTWILIADATRARLLRNEGPGRGVQPVSGTELEGINLPGREIMADRPGRTFDSVGLGRHAKEPRTDPREVERVRFTREIADALEEGLKRGAYDRLVLVAPPRTLGQLRAELPKAVRDRVSVELDKDLVHVPDHDLPDHLGAVMAV